MDREKLRLMSEVVGVTAIVLSLLFLAWQIRQEQVIAFSDLRATTVASGIELNALIIENRDIWVRGNAGEELSPAEAEAFVRLVQTMNDFYYNLVKQSETLGLGWEDADRAVLIGFLHENPGARRVWRAREEQLTRWREQLGAYEANPGVQVNEWVDVIEQGIANLDAAEESESLGGR